MSRDSVLHKVRTALGRSVGQPPEPPPPVYLNGPVLSTAERIAAFTEALETLAGKVFHAETKGEAREYVAQVVGAATAVTSNAPFLVECGIRDLPGVRGGFTDREELRAPCATAQFGITSADYALANTGTMVMIASPQEQRLVSLLPPVHIAVIPVARLLASLEELLETLPRPADVDELRVLKKRFPAGPRTSSRSWCGRAWSGNRSRCSCRSLGCSKRKERSAHPCI